MAKLYYTNRELEQGSEKWLAMRKTCIGASDLGTILNLTTKYTTPKQWWKRRTGRLKPKTMSAGMERGTLMEREAADKIKEYLQLEEGIKNPKFTQYFAKHPKFPFLGVSFDGVDTKNKFITEIKCPMSHYVFKSVFENGIQEYYYPQVQAQLSVAREIWGIERAFFGSYFPDGAYLFDGVNFVEKLKTLAVLDFDYDEHYFTETMKVAKVMWDFVENDYWDDKIYREALDEFKKNGISTVFNPDRNNS